MSRKAKLNIDMDAFAKDLRLGMKLAALATKYSISIASVSRCKKQLAKLSAEAESEDPTPAEQVFELKIDVPDRLLNSLLDSLTEAELRAAVGAMAFEDLAEIMQFALQQRIDKPIEGESNEARSDPS